jgi:hypothetical protein
MKPLAMAAALSLVAVSLLATSDLLVTAQPFTTTIRAGYGTTLYVTVRNNGPDAAPAVKLAVSADVPTTCGCDLGDIPAGQMRSGSISFTAPGTAGTINVGATASSSATDPNPGDNTVSVAYSVSTDPDVTLSISVPVTQDLALPFPLTIYLGNNSKTTANNVEVTIDFRTDVVPKTLPAGCSSPYTGRVVCRLDAVTPAFPNGPAFSLTMVAPSFWNNGDVSFTAVATEREHDYDPISNVSKAQMTLYRTFYVTSTANEGGPGTLREAIVEANFDCLGNNPCAIAFRIDEGSSKPWKTIRITNPLPILTGQRVRIDGATQTAFFGDTNPNGPEIEISGGGRTDGDGLLVMNCGTEIANLAVNGFLRNGISVTNPASKCATFAGANLHHLFVGTDPTGSSAVPNARGVGTSVANGNDFGTTGYATNITDSVISGNLHSGVFGMSGRLNIARNRIGVAAHTDDPLPNGNAGVFIGPGGYGSDVGGSYFAAQNPVPDTDGNVIAFNGEMGVAVTAGVADVAIRNNHIWGNALLGIDIGLDGPTQTSATVMTMPTLTLAHYDPVSRQTVIEGEASNSLPFAFNVTVDLFANDAPDPTGLGEGQRPLGKVRFTTSPGGHFRFAVDGDLTGKFISATSTRMEYIGFAKPEGIDQGFLTQTSEFSPTIEVR